VNSSANSSQDWYEEGKSRVAPHVCTMGVLPIPSTELNDTENVCSTITSEPVTNSVQTSDIQFRLQRHYIKRFNELFLESPWTPFLHLELAWHLGR